MTSDLLVSQDTAKAALDAAGITYEAHDNWGFWIDSDYRTPEDALHDLTTESGREPILNEPIQSALPEPDANGWFKDDVWAVSGDGCGDSQVGQAYSAQYHKPLPDGAFAVLTSTYYVEVFGDSIGVTEQIETMRCRDLEDIGGTEIDCDYQYDERGYLSHTTTSQAEREAKRYALADERNSICWFND